MSTRTQEIRIESGMDRVPTRDLDPDPGNGLKNENRQNQQRASGGQQISTVPREAQIEFRKALEQQPPSQTGSRSFRPGFNIIRPQDIEELLSQQTAARRQAAAQQHAGAQRAITVGGTGMPQTDPGGFGTPQAQPDILVDTPRPGQPTGVLSRIAGLVPDSIMEARARAQSQQLTGGPPGVFDPRVGAGLVSGDTTIRDVPFLGDRITPEQAEFARGVGQQPVGLGEFPGGERLPGFVQDVEVGGPAVPFAGPPGLGVGTAERAIRGVPGALRSVPGRLRIGGSRGQQQLTGPLETAQRGIQRGQQAIARIRAPQGVTGPPQRPGDILARQPVGSGVGGGGVGPELMRVSRLQDIAMQQRQLDRLRAAEQAQIALAQRGQQQQQLGMTALGVGGAVERLQTAQQPAFSQFTGPPGVMEQLGVPAQMELARSRIAQQQRVRPEQTGPLEGFGSQIARPDVRQFATPGQFGITQQPVGQRPGTGIIQQQHQFAGQPSFTTQVTGQVTGQRFTPRQITPGFNVPPPRTPPTPPIRIPPSFQSFIPPPIAPPLGGGGGGTGRRDLRGFPFGMVREQSPAFPGTAIRVLPDGSVVFDLDPGESPAQAGVPPRDPNTGQFMSTGG